MTTQLVPLFSGGGLDPFVLAGYKGTGCFVRGQTFR